MSEQQDALQNPFSKEKAYITFQENMQVSSEMWGNYREKRKSGTASTRELLLEATEILGRLTDNTILAEMVRKGLEAREKE